MNLLKVTLIMAQLITNRTIVLSSADVEKAIVAYAAEKFASIEKGGIIGTASFSYSMIKWDIEDTSDSPTITGTVEVVLPFVQKDI